MKALHCCRPLVGLLALAAVMAGCSAFNRGQPRLDSSAGMFDKAEVSYRVDAARLNATPRPEGQLVSYQPDSAATLPAGTEAEVEIVFPHPEKREGYAQVTVRVFGNKNHSQTGRISQWWKSGWKLSGFSASSAALEVWVLDVPQNDVAGIINGLHNTGYFTSYDKPADGVQIETVLDGAKVTKTWHQVPQLDALIVRVRTQGRLLSSPRSETPHLFQGISGKTPSSVQAYRKLQDEEGAAMVSDLEQTPFPAPPAFQVVRLPPIDSGTSRR